MTGQATGRQRLNTNLGLLNQAGTVLLQPPADRAVFYVEDFGAQLAATFVASNPGYVRLDELLQSTPAGRSLWSSLTSAGRPWNEMEEVWWQLSWRLARAAIGVVNVFGPGRLVEDRPLSEFKHKFSQGSYANTVFEKVELPELASNPSVTSILYNGKSFK